MNPFDTLEYRYNYAFNLYMQFIVPRASKEQLERIRVPIIESRNSILSGTITREQLEAVIFTVLDVVRELESPKDNEQIMIEDSPFFKALG